MSFLFGGGRRQPSSAEKLAMAEAEMEMSMTLFQGLINSCVQKCVPTGYHEADLNKGESVCLDRCVSKFFSTFEKVQQKSQEGNSQQGGGGGGGGFFG